MRNPAKPSFPILLLILALFLTVFAQSALGRPLTDLKTGQPTVTRDDCVDRAVVDPVYYGGGGGHALWLPGIGRDFRFDFKPGRLLQQSGSAVLTGTARRASNPAKAFEVSITIGGYSASAPPGSPKKELRASAYIENGGPVDPSTWWYYTEFEGTLTGIEDYAGAVIEVTRRGPAFQLGYGANGKNIELGGSSWINWDVVSQPYGGGFPSSGHGDFNIEFSVCNVICVERADSDLDYLSASAGGSAFQLIGIARDFIFTKTAYFVEYDDGTAKLKGFIHKETFPHHRFEVDLEFTGHSITPPGPGSPKLELPDMAYASGGGPINPSGWRYYSQVSGTLTGLGFFEGAVLDMQSYGPAFQIGHGANGKNTLHGGSGWIGYEVVQQPNNTYLPTSGDGDMSVNDCPPVVHSTPMSGCGAAQVVAYKPGFSAMASSPAAERRNPAAALGMPEDEDELNFVSLGYSGVLILKMDGMIWNQAGPDIHLYNTTFAQKSCAQYPERAWVWASQNGADWVRLGASCQDGALDLGSLTWAQYILIEDTTDYRAFFYGEAADGFDVDGVVGLHCSP